MKHNQSFYFKKGLKFYDIVFTTKSYNLSINELPSLGAKKVVFVEKGFDRNIHAPICLSDDDRRKYRNDVGFIGTFEKDRFDQLLALAKRGIKIRVWGNGWRRYIHHHANLLIEDKPIYEKEYQKAIGATKINLCFLRKINRDLQTDRSVEIPACGAFMLAERTKEHEGLFVDGKEAVFFENGNIDELYQKVVYYLKHEDERVIIAQAGRERCIRSKYSHEDRLTFMLEQVKGLYS